MLKYIRVVASLQLSLHLAIRGADLNNYYCMIIAQIWYTVILCSTKHLQYFLTMLLIVLRLSIIYSNVYISITRGSNFRIDTSS